MLAEVDELDPAQQVARRPGTSTCPPCPAAHTLAARCTSTPTYPSDVTIGSPVWIPMRTLTGPSASAACAPSAAATASEAREKATKKASPCVSTSTPRGGQLVAQRQPVLREDTRVALVPELGEKPRRALDVGKQKGDGASGKSAHTASFLPLFRRKHRPSGKASNPAQHPPGDPASCHPCDASRTGTSSSPARSRRPRRT